MTTTFSVSTAGVREIAGAVARGEVTPLEVMASVLQRIEETEPKIQAWSQFDAGIAQAQAETLTAEARAGKLRGPLHGVPVAIKEWFHVQGFPTLLKGPSAQPEPVDSTVVARLREAGAIIVGKTHTPLGGKTPPTRNPWNLGHTAGGSSSGSGAVVGARVVPMAIGEQTGGSNLRPAAYCGVGGIKPSYGTISRFGLYPGSWSKDHPGLMGFDMEDMALVLSVVGGYDPLDPTTIPLAAPSADLKMSEFAPPRIGVVRNFFPELTEPEMQAAIERSALSFQDAGATVLDVMLPEQYGLAWDAADMAGAEGAVFHAEERAASKPTMEDLVPTNIAVSRRRMSSGRAVELIPATYYIQGRRIRTWLTGLVTTMMREQGLDALLMAVAPGAAPAGIASTGDATLLTPWSVLGFPAITVNGGLSSDGLPLGLQLVAPMRDDYNLMRVGAWCERTLGLLPAPTIA